MLLKYRYLVLLLLSSLLFTGCMGVKVREVKDFRIYVDTDDLALRDAVVVLADQFNKDVGAHALTVVEDRDSANSVIHFVPNLTLDRKHKLGLGRWITSQSEENSLKATGPVRNLTVAYAMDIEFDQENFARRVAQVEQPTTDEYQHLYHLFCHEVGHGMQLDHSLNKSDVMFESIPDTTVRKINYNSFFNQVRSFLRVEAAAPRSVADDSVRERTPGRTNR